MGEWVTDFPRNRLGGMSGTLTIWQRYMGNPAPAIASVKRINENLLANSQQIAKLTQESKGSGKAEERIKVRREKDGKKKLIRKSEVVSKCKKSRKFY